MKSKGAKQKGTYCMQRWQPRDQVRVQGGGGLGPKTALPPPTVGHFCGGFRWQWPENVGGRQASDWDIGRYEDENS